MTNSNFCKIIIFVLIAQCKILFAPIDFQGLYTAADDLYWAGWSNKTLNQTQKDNLKNLVTTIASNKDSLDEWQLTPARDLVNRVIDATFLTQAEKTDYINLKSNLDLPPKPKYQLVSDRLIQLQAQINIISSSADILAMGTTLGNLLKEVYGSEKDKGLFLMVIKALKNKATFVRIPTTSLDAIESAAKTITNDNRIQFLERVLDSNNFTSPEERALFLNVIKTLRESMDKLSDNEITRMHTSIVTALSSTNFTDDDKKLLWAIGNEVVDYFNNTRLSQDSGSSSTVAENEQENFAVIFAQLQSKFKTIDANYKQGNQTDALTSKTNEFYPMLGLLQDYIGDMITLEYQSLPPINAGSTAIQLPPLAGSDATGIKNEQQLILDFFSLVVTSRVFSLDKVRFDSFKKVFGDPVSAATKIKYLEDSYANKELSAENKKRFLWHVRCLIEYIGNSDKNKILTSDQQSRLLNLITVLNQADSFAEYNSSSKPIATALKNAYNAKLQGAASVISQSLSSKFVTITPVGATDKFLGIYDYSNVNTTDYRMEAHSGYQLEPQNVFKITTTQTPGEILLSYDAGSKGNLALYMNLNESVAKLKTMPSTITATDPSFSEFIFVFTDSSLDNIRLKSKGTSSYLSYFDAGTISAVNPITKTPLINESSNQRFKLQVLSDLETTLVSARRSTSPLDVIKAYTNITTQAVDNYQKSKLVQDMTYYLNNLINSGSLTLEIYQKYSSLVDDLSARPDYLDIMPTINILRQTLQRTTPTTSSLATKVIDATSDSAVYMVFEDQAKVAIQFGNVEAPSTRYLAVDVDGTNYYIRAKKTSPADKNAQFTIIKKDFKVMLESVAYPGLVIANDSTRTSINQDLNLIPKTANSDPNTLFATVKSAIDPSKICLVNAGSKGVLSIMADSSVLTTNMVQGWTEQDSSRFSIIKIDTVLADLTELQNPKSTKYATLTIGQKATKYFDWVNKTTTQDMAFAILREMYGWLLSLKKSQDGWKRFVISQDSTAIISKINSIMTSTVKKNYANCGTLINAIKSLLTYNPEASLTLYPTDKEVFWLAEEAFVNRASAKVGYTFAIKTTGFFEIFIDKDPASFATGEKYKITIGEVGQDGTRQVIIYKNKSPVASAVCADFIEQDFAEYQIVFERGSMAFYSRSGLVTSFDDSQGPLLNVSTDPSATITVGLSTESDITVVDRITASLELQMLDFFSAFETETPSARITRIINVLTNAKSIDTANPNDSLIGALNEIQKIADFQNRFMYFNQDINNLKTNLTTLKSKRFVSVNYSASALTNDGLTKLNMVPTRNDYINFITNLIDKLSFYINYSGKNAGTETLLKNICKENITNLISKSYEDFEKNEVATILGGRLMTEQILDQNWIYQMMNILQNQVKIALDTKGLSLPDQIAQVQKYLSTIQSIDQRDTILNYIDSIVNQVTKLSAADRTSINSSLVAFADFLTKLSSVLVFKDILGSLDYLSFVMTNFMSPTEYLLTNLLAPLNNGSKTLDDFFNGIQTLSNTVLSWMNKGIHDLHAPIISTYIDSLASNDIRQNIKVTAQPTYLNKIDVIISSLRAKGDINKVIAERKSVIPSIQTTTARTTFLSSIESSLVMFIESQIASGSVKESDRTAINSFLTELQNNSSFKDLASMTKLTEFTKRVNVSVDPTIRITDMTNRPSTLAGDEASTDQYLADLKSLSSDLKTFIANGGTLDATKVSAFNKLIDDIKAKSSTEGTTGIYQWIFYKRTYQNPPLDLDSLKMGSMDAYDMLSRASSLVNRLKTDTSNSDLRTKLLADYDQFITDWRIAVVFDKNKADLTNTTYRPIYQKMTEFFTSAMQNIALGSRWDATKPNSFEVARQDMLENKFDAIDKAASLKAFFANPGIGGKTVDEVYNAVNSIVSDFIYYRNLIFNTNDNLNVIIDLIDNVCKKKVELTSIFSKLDALKQSLTVQPTINDRITTVNQELITSINSTSLSETQKTNLLSVCSALVTLITQTSPATLQAQNMNMLKNNLQTLINKGTFSSQAQSSLTSLVTTLSNTITNLPASSTVTSPTTGSTPPTTTPVIITIGTPTTQTPTTTTPAPTTSIGGSSQQPTTASPTNPTQSYNIAPGGYTGNFGNFNNNPNYEQPTQRPNTAFRKINYR